MHYAMAQNSKALSSSD